MQHGFCIERYWFRNTFPSETMYLLYLFKTAWKELYQRSTYIHQEVWKQKKHSFYINSEIWMCVFITVIATDSTLYSWWLDLNAEHCSVHNIVHNCSTEVWSLNTQIVTFKIHVLIWLHVLESFSYPNILTFQLLTCSSDCTMANFCRITIKRFMTKNKTEGHFPHLKLPLQLLLNVGSIYLIICITSI
jgi:hypothetical protein